MADLARSSGSLIPSFDTTTNRDHYLAYGEHSLWRAVIMQALLDAGSDSKKRYMRLHKAQAISWLSGISEDFRTVCALAELEPRYVKERAREAIAAAKSSPRRGISPHGVRKEDVRLAQPPNTREPAEDAATVSYITARTAS